MLKLRTIFQTVASLEINHGSLLLYYLSVIHVCSMPPTDVTTNATFPERSYDPGGRMSRSANLLNLTVPNYIVTWDYLKILSPHKIQLT